MGPQLRQPTPEEDGGMTESEKLDRLAALLSNQSPDRLAAFWNDIMGKRKAAKGPPTIADQLKAAIAASGRTHYDIGKEADIDPGVILRFMSDERMLRLDNAGKIAAALDLVLVPRESVTSSQKR